MKKATDELLKTHQVVYKVLEGFDVGNRRFPDIMNTLHRTLLAHAWLQDEILLPVLRMKPLIDNRLLEEIVQEHKELEHLLKNLIDTSLYYPNILEEEVLKIRTLIESHFKKEREVLYPLVEKSVDHDTLIKLGDGMAYHQAEIREVAWN